MADEDGFAQQANGRGRLLELSEHLGMLRPSRLRRGALGLRAAGLAGLVAAAFGLGVLWVIALDAPFPGKL